MYMGVSINGDIQRWMVYKEKSIYKGMIWGYPYFRKPPYVWKVILFKHCLFFAGGVFLGPNYSQIPCVFLKESALQGTGKGTGKGTGRELGKGKGTGKTQQIQSRPRKGIGKTKQLQSCLRKRVGKAQQLQSCLRKGNGRTEPAKRA